MSIVPHVLRDRLSVVTDEVHLDLGIAVHALRNWGVTHADIRSVGVNRVPRFDDSTLAAVRRASADITIGALSPGLFKGEVRGAAFEEERDVTLPRVLQLAADLDVAQVIVFGGGRSELMQDVETVLAEARATAASRGIDLLVENSALCRVADGEDLLHVAEQLDMRVVWDPANAISAGSPDLRSPSRALAPHAACVHVRDWHPELGWRRMGEGTMPWPHVIAELESEGFVGRYVVESHLPDDPGASEWNLRTLADMLSGRP